jgi:hypothetical protein
MPIRAQAGVVVSPSSLEHAGDVGLTAVSSGPLGGQRWPLAPVLGEPIMATGSPRQPVIMVVTVARGTGTVTMTVTTPLSAELAPPCRGVEGRPRGFVLLRAGWGAPLAVVSK